MLGQYAVYGELAAGGMATIHFGRLATPDGHTRTVAIKRLHPQFAKDAEFRTMFLDEARVAVHVAHPNVVTTLDVVGMETELFLVMEYVVGESLSKLIRQTREKKKVIPPGIAAAVMAGAMRGLHAAHTAHDVNGQPLQIVHRDISPQNILVGVDGVARVLDFGVAKAVGRAQQTREGQLKGKIAYMAPEQLNGVVSPRTDIYAAGVTLWEALTAKRLFNADNEAAILGKILSGKVEPPSAQAGLGPSTDRATRDLWEKLDAITLRALSRDENHWYFSAAEMAEALEQLPLAGPQEIGRFVEKTAHDGLRRRSAILSAIEKNDVPFGRASRSTEALESASYPGAVSSRSNPSGTPPAIERSQFARASATADPSRMKPLLLVAGVLALGILFAAVGAAVAVKTNGPPKPPSIPPAQAVEPPLRAPEAPAPLPSASTPSPSPKADEGIEIIPNNAPAAPGTPRDPRPRKPKCEPSYVDANGHKQYRPECL